MINVKLQFVSEEAAQSYVYAAAWNDEQPQLLSATEVLTQCEQEELGGLQWMVDHAAEDGRGLSAFTVV